MTLFYVPNVWVSDADDTDCKECGLRWFAECVKCRKITCTWCAFAFANPGSITQIDATRHVCTECQESMVENKK